MESLHTLKKEILDKKVRINEMVQNKERMTAPEIVKLSVELDLLLNKLFDIEHKHMNAQI